MPTVEHLAVDRPGPFGGTMHTTLCNRVRNDNDSNRTFEIKNVTCKFCLRKFEQLAELAYSAIERDSLSGDLELAAKADDAMPKLLNRTLDSETLWHYVVRQREWQTFNM